MFKFFKGKESTKVKRIRAVRATYVGPDHNEVHIEFESEDRSLPRFSLELTPTQARGLIDQLMNAYEAINPPMVRGDRAAGWMGME